MKNIFLHTLLILFLCSCNKATNTSVLEIEEDYKPQYAKGFEILKPRSNDGKIIKIKNPWQGAQNIESSIYITSNESNVPKSFEGQILAKIPNRIICTSTSHIAILDALGATKKIVGVSGKNYISNKYICENNDKIVDIGYDGNINYELLIASKPDLVLLFGVNGANSMESRLKELNIPFMYIGEYLEESPLGKSEWLIPISELVGETEKGKQIFDEISNKYNTLKNTVDKDSYHPLVMLNVPYGDSWFMPSSTSYAAQLIEDAGGEYIYQKDTSNQSKAIDIEEAYTLVSKSDYWLNVGMINNLTELTNLYPKFSNVSSVKNKKVYNNTKRNNANGGNDYWESGIVHPDLILNDLIQILHSEKSNNLYYYKQLE